jgi:cytochrome c
VSSVVPYINTSANAGAEGRCRGCHTFADKDAIGPGLGGVFGRKAGTKAGFAYTDSLKNADWIWDEEHLRKWVFSAKEAIKEFTGDPNATTKMPDYKYKDAKADEIIEFLKGLK